MSAKKNATVAPRTVLKRLKQSDAPLSNHHGLFVTKAFKSLPNEAELTVASFSHVSLKHRRNRMKQHEAITIMANCQLDWIENPKESWNNEHNGSQAKRAINDPP